MTRPDGQPRQLESLAAVESSYDHVYLSPHFDDLALSAGGTVIAQRALGQSVLVLTVCTARPPAALTPFAEFQHGAWGGASDPHAEREAEERAAMRSLDVDYLWIDLLDAIYRGEQYLSDADLFGPVKAGDAGIANRLRGIAEAIATVNPGAWYYLPLAAGGHVDHRLCSALEPSLAAYGGRTAWYEDQPYALDQAAVDEQVRLLPAGSRPVIVEFGAMIERKLDAVRCYASQIPWIFRESGDASVVLRAHATSVSRIAGSAERFWTSDGDGTSFGRLAS